MNLPSQNQITQLLLQKIQDLGQDRKLEDLTVGEIFNLSDSIITIFVNAQKDDEPPF